MNTATPTEENTQGEEIELAKTKTEDLYNILTSPKINYEALFDLLNSTTNYERQIISSYYQYKYQKNLIELISKLFTSDLKDILTYFFYSPYELDARILNKSLHSFRKDEKAIIEIFASRPQWYLQKINEEYQKLFNISLNKEFEKEKKNEFYIFLRCLLDTPRNEGQTITTPEEAEKIASEIVQKGIKNYGKNVDLFKEIFVQKSREDFILIGRAFKKLNKNNKNLVDTVEAQCGSKTRGLIRGLIHALVSPSNYFALCLKKSIVGLGTDNNTLNRVLVSRNEIDMKDIREQYLAETGRTLEEDIKGDTSGEYETFLLLLANK